MSIPEQAGKVATHTIDALKATPMAFSMLILNIAFLGFAAFMLGSVAANSAERNKSQIELITKLVTDIRDCRQGVRTLP